jgi:hypothetical protein
MAFKPVTAINQLLKDNQPMLAEMWANMTPEEQAAAEKRNAEAQAINRAQTNALVQGDKPWWQRGLETAADLSTFGQYSTIKEAAGGDSSSYASPVDPKNLETAADLSTFGQYSAGKKALGFGNSQSYLAPGSEAVFGDAFGAISDATGLSSLGGGSGGPGPDVTGIQAGGKQLFDQAMANYGRKLDPTEIREVPQVTGERVQAATAGPVATYSAPTVAASREVSAPTIAAARDVTAPTIAPSSLVEGVGPLNAALAGGTDVGRAQLSGGPQDQIRNLQTGSLAGLQELAEGKGPAAELEKARLDSALARVSDEAYAAANASRGAGKGAARLQTALALVGEGGKAALAARENALASQIAARGQVVQAAQGVRAQDIDFAGQAAQLEQQANNLQAQIEAARQLGNAAEVNRLTSQQATLKQQAQEFNAQAQNQRAAQQASMGLQAAEGNAGRESQRNISQAGMTLQASEGNAGREAGRNSQQAGLTADALKFGAGATNDASQAQAGRQQQANVTNAGNTIQVQTTNAGNQLATDKARADSTQGAFAATTQAQGTAGQTAAAGLGAQSDAIKATVAAEDAANKKKAADREFLMEAGAKAATVLSDERSKQNVAEITPNALDGFAEAIARKIKTWEYKPGEGPPGVHAGPMAQDVEDAGPLGEALVHYGDDGRKYIDQDSIGNLLLAAALRSKKVSK